MAEYEITQLTEDGYEEYSVFNFRCDLTQASCPVEIQSVGGWEVTPFQAADGDHDEKYIAKILLSWKNWDSYNNRRPFRLKRVRYG